jgi:Sulfotransferase domain
MTDQNRDSTDRPVRKDLASRLLRPHWPFFRSGAAEPSREASARYDDVVGPREPSRQPVDVICAGMYRACSTWQYEIVAHLLERHCDGLRLGYLTGEEYARMVRVSAMRPPAGASLPAQWRVVKSHEGDRSFARAIAAKRAAAVYSHRDVRDVVFSLMHKRGITFEQILRHGMIHQILANDRFWAAQPGVLVQRYDDLIAHPANAVMELARHLGIPLEPGHASAIAELYSAEANRARAESLRRRLDKAGVDLKSADNAQICDPTTLLHWNHMRQGKAASWLASATEIERVILDRLCGRWLVAHGYPPDRGLEESRAARARSSRETVRATALVLAGRRTFMIRSASGRWPGVARALKRVLGLPAEGHAGATAWADPTPAGPVGHERQAHFATPMQPTQAGDPG